MKIHVTDEMVMDAVRAYRVPTEMANLARRVGKMAAAMRLALEAAMPRVAAALSSQEGARVLTCVYCGHEYPQDTPAAGHKVLTDHIAACASHPMRGVVEDRDRLRAALAALVGSEDPEELRAMELVIRVAPVPEQDRAFTIDAIHALLATAGEESNV